MAEKVLEEIEESLQEAVNCVKAILLELEEMQTIRDWTSNSKFKELITRENTTEKIDRKIISAKISLDKLTNAMIGNAEIIISASPLQREQIEKNWEVFLKGIAEAGRIVKTIKETGRSRKQSISLPERIKKWAQTKFR